VVGYIHCKYVNIWVYRSLTSTVNIQGHQSSIKLQVTPISTAYTSFVKCWDKFDLYMSVHRDIYFYSKTNKMHNISNLFYFVVALYMFRTVFQSIIRNLRLYIQHQVYVKQILLSAC